MVQGRVNNFDFFTFLVHRAGEKKAGEKKAGYLRANKVCLKKICDLELHPGPFIGPGPGAVAPPPPRSRRPLVTRARLPVPANQLALYRTGNNRAHPQPLADNFKIIIIATDNSS